MSFQPLVPVTGYAGWALLNRTLDDQLEAFNKSPVNERDMAYFRENIPNVVFAEDLVSDYQLLRVALGAFGLQDDLPNKAYIQKVLEEGTSDPDAFVNRLTDTRYFDLAEAFGFGELAAPKTLQVGFADRILARFERQEFEIAVGQQSEEFRIALNLQRQLPELVEDTDNDTAWLSIMGNPPMRAAFETALGMPDSFALIDIDQQLTEFKDRAQSFLGTDQLAEIATEDGIDNVIKNYLGRAQLASITNVASSASIALTLLAPLTR